MLPFPGREAKSWKGDYYSEQVINSQLISAWIKLKNGVMENEIKAVSRAYKDRLLKSAKALG